MAAMAALEALEERFESVFQTLVPINALSVPRQHQLLAQAEILEFRPRDFIFREGDRDNYAYFLLDGRLDLLAQEQLVKRIQGGASEGRHALAQ
jgi:CRP-like cAMP-binding protein